jgi:diguanylate cyclase (GGDEF)-like protein
MKRNRLHVLLIEDDDDDYVLVRDLLGELGDQDITLQWEMTYETGKTALQSGEHDICLMDYRLGARDGIELLRELGTTTPPTPIIFLTGQDSRDLDVQAMEAGAADYLVKGKIDPLVLERSIRYALERQRLLQEMHRRSLVDELTGVLNRRGLEEQMVREMKLARRRNQTMALLFVDVDNFKAVNDEHGHAEGDRALREVADLLAGSFRQSDLVARIGGDEFVVVALDTTIDDIAIPEKRLQKGLERRNNSHRPYRLSLTLGISVYDPARPCSFWELVAQADQQMYERKTASAPAAKPTPAAPPAPCASGGKETACASSRP